MYKKGHKKLRQTLKGSQVHYSTTWGCLWLTQTNSKVAFGPDAEIKEQVLVEML